MEFKKKNIYIISKEGWGKMLMSKHHYSIELGKAGNKVFFINFPDQRKEYARGEVKVDKTGYDNVYSVSHRFFHPYFFKFRYKWLYQLFTNLHIKKLIRKVGHKPDIVWTFDTSNTLPIKYFPQCEVKIFMPVDGPFGSRDEIESAEDASAVISVTSEILETFKHIEVPQYLINHGVSDIFFDSEADKGQNKPVRIGYSGSLIRNDLDTAKFIQIIQTHKDKAFEFWGEYDYTKSNMHLPQDVSKETKDFISALKTFDNVKLHGAVSPSELALGLKNMDVLFICYILHHSKGNVRNDQNHHKVLEYLATGKVIVSSYMSVYSIKYPGLIEMARDKQNNDEIPEIFDRVIDRLDFYNSLDKRRQRIDFARQFTYSKQILNIQNFINDSVLKHA